MRFLWVLIHLAVCVSIFIPQFSSDAHGAINRSFSLDIGYIPAIGSNYAFWDFGHTLEDLGSLVFDTVNDETFFGDNFITRTLWGAGMWFVWTFPQNAFFLSNHEYGHGTRVTAAGGTVTYGFENNSSTHGNIFTYWLQALFTSGGGFASGTGATTSPTNWGGVVSAGGVNNSALMGEYLEDQMLEGRGHILSSYLYRRVKLDSYDYVNNTLDGVTILGSAGDMDAVVTHYNSIGHSIRLEDIRFGGLAALLASSTTYSYIYSFFRYMATGDPSVQSPHIGSFRLPNFSHFLNAEGISFRARFGFSEGGLFEKASHTPISVEYQYLGKKAIEVGVGHQVPEGISWMVFGNSLAAFGARGTYRVRTGSAGRFAVRAGVYQLDSFEGARIVQKNLSSDIGIEASVRYSVLF